MPAWVPPADKGLTHPDTVPWTRPHLRFTGKTKSTEAKSIIVHSKPSALPLHVGVRSAPALSFRFPPYSVTVTSAASLYSRCPLAGLGHGPCSPQLEYRLGVGHPAAVLFCPSFMQQPE